MGSFLVLLSGGGAQLVSTNASADANTNVVPDFCNILVIEGKRGKMRTVRFMYFNGVPVILTQGDLIINSYVGRLGGKIVSGEINLVDGHAIFLHLRYVKSHMWLPCLFHELGHLKLRHHLHYSVKGSRLREVSAGQVSREELEADRFAASHVGTEQYLTFLTYLLRSISSVVRRREQLADNEANSLVISYKLDRLAKSKLSQEEIRLRIAAIESLTLSSGG